MDINFSEYWDRYEPVFLQIGFKVLAGIGIPFPQMDVHLVK